jgi:hypothetical protein
MSFYIYQHPVLNEKQNSLNYYVPQTSRSFEEVGTDHLGKTTD